VPEPGQRQLLGAHGAAGLAGGLQHEDVSAGSLQPDRGSEPVGPAADHDRVGVEAHAASAAAS
jgi:hypothetical protein